MLKNMSKENCPECGGQLEEKVETQTQVRKRYHYGNSLVGAGSLAPFTNQTVTHEILVAYCANDECSYKSKE